MPLKDHAPRAIKDTANVATRAWGLATAQWRSGPDFLIVGTKRGGTTSLWQNLLQHPEVLGLFPEIRGRKSTDYYFRDGAATPRWYRSHFPSRLTRAARARRGLRTISGEASPYYLYSPHAAGLIARDYPDARIIILLRDPVERAYSHYQERRKQGTEQLAFEDALAAEADRLAVDEQRWLNDPTYYSSVHDFMSYRTRGIYLPQVKRFADVFPASQLLIERAEDFYQDYQAGFDRVCEFLGISTWKLPQAVHRNKIPRSPMRDETRRSLAEFYSTHNEALEAFLGRQMGWQTP